MSKQVIQWVNPKHSELEDDKSKHEALFPDVSRYSILPCECAYENKRSSQVSRGHTDVKNEVIFLFYLLYLDKNVVILFTTTSYLICTWGQSVFPKLSIIIYFINRPL